MSFSFHFLNLFYIPSDLFHYIPQSFYLLLFSLLPVTLHFSLFFSVSFCPLSFFPFGVLFSFLSILLIFTSFIKNTPYLFFVLLLVSLFFSFNRSQKFLFSSSLLRPFAISLCFPLFRYFFWSSFSLLQFFLFLIFYCLSISWLFSSLLRLSFRLLFSSFYLPFLPSSLLFLSTLISYHFMFLFVHYFFFLSLVVLHLLLYVSFFVSCTPSLRIWYTSWLANAWRYNLGRNVTPQHPRF